MSPHRADLRFVIIGAGMAGVLAAIKLREAGFTDVSVYEKAGRLGGTWRENTYPGVACDVPAHLYTYSFAPNPEWSHAFAPGPEILAYFEGVARRYGVEELVRYGHAVRRLEYDGSCWRIETSTGERDEADVVIAATGVLHHPRYPDINGLNELAASSIAPAGTTACRWQACESGWSAPARRRCRSPAPSPKSCASCICSSAPRSGSCRSTTRPSTRPGGHATGPTRRR
ncbi:flavin-containing monooxygenase [Mycobacterium kansasii]